MLLVAAISRLGGSNRSGGIGVVRISPLLSSALSAAPDAVENAECGTIAVAKTVVLVAVRGFATAVPVGGFATAAVAAAAARGCVPPAATGSPMRSFSAARYVFFFHFSRSEVKQSHDPIIMLKRQEIGFRAAATRRDPIRV